MITGELKSRIDRIWDTMWSGGISNPLSVIEQFTYLLFIKRLDELHTLQERKAARTGRPIQEPVFTARENGLRWSRFKELAPEQMFETVRDRVFPFIKSLRRTRDADEGSTCTQHMVIDQLTARGVMEQSALYEPPFTSLHGGGPEALFADKSNVIEGIFEKLKTLRPERLAEAG